MVEEIGGRREERDEGREKGGKKMEGGREEGKRISKIKIIYTLVFHILSCSLRSIFCFSFSIFNKRVNLKNK